MLIAVALAVVVVLCLLFYGVYATFVIAAIFALLGAAMAAVVYVLACCLGLLRC